VELIAVSKTFPAEAVREPVEAGQRVFGESRLQEAEPKIAMLPGLLSWHFIGRVQRNKVRRMLPLFDVIHGVDSLRLATYMDGVASELGLFPKVFLQVNIGGELSKGGFEPAEITAQAAEIMALPRLQVLGLMCIPPPCDDAVDARCGDHLVASLQGGDAGLQFLALALLGPDEQEIEHHDHQDHHDDGVAEEAAGLL
jgi:pyridoxal phosphate enzyme (YggS family)